MYCNSHFYSDSDEPKKQGLIQTIVGFVKDIIKVQKIVLPLFSMYIDTYKDCLLVYALILIQGGLRPVLENYSTFSSVVCASTTGCSGILVIFGNGHISKPYNLRQSLIAQFIQNWWQFNK